MDNARIEPYSPDWFKLRCGTFTASEIWKLMTEPRNKKDQFSKTAETYILEKVHEKITGQVKNGINNYATEWGIDNEPLALNWYAKLTKNELHDSYLVFDNTDWFSCTPDRFVNTDGLVEVKCPANGSNHFKHCFITTDEYFKSEHPEYYWQCMAQMAICKRDWVDFVSFDPRVDTNLGMFIYRLKRNEDEIGFMYSKLNSAKALFESYYELFSKNG